MWSIFAADTDYWPLEQQVMVNFRVDDLDAMLEQLRAAGAEVDGRASRSWSSAASAGPSDRRQPLELWQPT